MREGPVVEISVVDGDRGDERIDLSARLIQFEFEDESEKADLCRIQLDNYDLAMLDSEIWQRGQRLRVSWGYEGNMSAPQEVIIKRVYGNIVLNVEGIAASVEMNKVQRTEAFHNATRSRIAELIAKRNGFYSGNYRIKSTFERFETINQAGETDAQLLKRLARREGFIFYVDAGGLYWGPEEFDGAPSHKLIYFTDPGRGDIIDWNMDTDLFDAPGEISVKGRNPDTGEVFEEKSSDSETKYTDLGNELEVVDDYTARTRVQKRMVHKRVVHTSASDRKAAKAEADAKFRKAAQEKIRLSLTAIGDPNLKAKRVIDVSGLGNYLSGKYWVSTAVHTVGDGYLTKLKMKRGIPPKAPGRAAQSSAGKNTKSAPKDGEEGKLIDMVEERTGNITYHRGKGK